MSISITGNSLGELVENARHACRDGAIVNLLIEGRYQFDELDTPFMSTYRKQGELWQSKVRPPKLHICHGEYIHRHGDGIRYLIDELVKKPTGNRAVLSLIDMNDLIDSADNARPSFLTFQAGFESGDKSAIHISLYYRALEVSRFLPINLAEAGIVLQQIREAIPEIQAFHLLIHAFRAYEDRNFNCLVRDDLDVEDVGAIEAAVKSVNTEKLRVWLHSKCGATTIIETDALVLLREAMAENGSYPEPLLDQIDEAIRHLVRLATFRRAGSHMKSLDETKTSANKCLAEAIKMLEKIS